jgi:hypothetical protein
MERLTKIASAECLFVDQQAYSLCIRRGGGRYRAPIFASNALILRIELTAP